MKAQKIPVVLGAALLAALTVPLGVLAEQPRLHKRVWTNDDFPPARSTATPPEAPAKPVPTAKPLAEKTPPASSESDTLHEEAPQERLATARLRQKAYERTATVIGSKLEEETDPFRREVYQRMLGDTLTLSETNRRLLNQREEKPQADKGGIVSENPKKRTP